MATVEADKVKKKDYWIIAYVHKIKYHLDMAGQHTIHMFTLLRYGNLSDMRHI